MLEWIEAHPSLSGWVQGVGTLVAAALALLAAYFAYRGANAQADVAEKIHRDTTENDRRALAAALWAELSDCREQIVHTAEYAISRTTIALYEPAKMRPLNFEIYEASLSVIGRLPSDLVLSVVQTCKVLRDRDEAIRRVIDNRHDTIDTQEAVAGLKGMLKSIDATLRKLEAVAGVAVKPSKSPNEI